MNFFGGPRAPLTTPPTCGTYTTTATLTPWSGNAPVTPATASRSPAPVARLPGRLLPKLEAGLGNPLGGRLSAPSASTSVAPTAPPGSKSVSVALPRGPARRSSPGSPTAPTRPWPGSRRREGTGAAQLATPSCPAASQVGTVTVGAGAGPSPFYVNTGKVYLAGPYKGAPLSLAIVTPAVAGPFDLGNVVVRTALQVDPETVEVTAVSDPLPTILDGIPLDLRDVRVNLNRPGFTLNPTNCSAKQFGGTRRPPSAARSHRSRRPSRSPSCGGLGFSPKLAARAEG